MRLRLAATWTLWTSALVFVALASGTLWMAQHVHDSARRSVAETQAALADAAAASVAGEIAEARHKLAAMGRLFERDGALANDAEALDRLLDPPDLFLEVAVWTDAFVPQLNVSSQQMSVDGDLGDRRPAPSTGQLTAYDPRITNARAGATFTSYDVQPVLGAPSISISAPATRGLVLVAAYDVRRLADVIERFDASYTRRVALFDAKGALVCESDAPWEGVLATERTLDDSGWRLVVEDDDGVLIAPLRAAHNGLLMLLVALTACSVGVALLLARRVVAPVRTLARAAERLGNGDLSVRCGIVRDDEIGELARTFDHMASSLQELDRLKSDFVAHVSHELRTPLASAVLSLANVEEGLAERSSLARVRGDLDRLVRLVERLLGAARVEAGLELALAPVTLAQIVNGAVDSLRPLARVPIDVSGSGPALELDALRVHQVVVNLVENALRHARSRVSVAIDGRTFTVADDGPGVPLADRERVFERFVRLDPNAPGRGVGLGLAIARKIVEQHGGSIRCEGSRFVVTF